ncbi:MAG: AAA family ATPase [Sphingobacteriia bacterium]|nr:AAA family ATPase [Sphingobacteriia bacterium]
MLNSLNGLSFDQLQVLEAIRNGRNVFITGHAGTGKSYLLKCIRDLYYGKGLHITASTGIAAVQIGGHTLHSWAGLGNGQANVEYLIDYILSGKGTYVRRKIKNCKMLAIDEISMLPGDIFNKLNTVLKAVKNSPKPFGGIQLILSGDFFQLPPVTKDNETPIFCFETRAWQEGQITTFCLQKIFRHSEQLFIDFLSNLRKGRLNDNDVALIKSRTITRPNNITPTFLATHNYQIEQINNTHLKSLSSKSFIYEMSSQGDEKKSEFLANNCIAPKVLELKIGALVMMLKNNYYKDGIINGSIGKIIDFVAEDSYHLPVVKFNNGVVKVIGFDSWNYEEFDLTTLKPLVKASIIQLPLNLAWAVTIHKSQGMTLDHIECDLSKTFASGQTYVAISRVKNLEGLFLKNFSTRYIQPNKKALLFEENNFTWQEEFV